MTFLEPLVMLLPAYVMTIAIVLLARPLVTQAAGTNWAYALWSVLLVPPLAALVPSTISDIIGILSYPTVSLSAANSAQNVLLGLWLVGMVITGSMSIRQSIQVRRGIEGSSRPLSDEQLLDVQRTCDRANVFPAPKTVTCSSLVSPSVMSGLSPTLVLPSDFFLKYSSSERNLILHHELVHLRRLDLIWNISFRCLRCLLWFVPFMKHCERMFRADQERSCDHSVVCDEPGSGRAEYARALYKTAVPIASATGTAGFRNTRHELVLRTELLGVHRRTKARSMTGFVALMVCILLTASVSANSNSLTASAIPSSGWCSVYSKLGQ